MLLLLPLWSWRRPKKLKPSRARPAITFPPVPACENQTDVCGCVCDDDLPDQAPQQQQHRTAEAYFFCWFSEAAARFQPLFHSRPKWDVFLVFKNACVGCVRMRRVVTDGIVCRVRHRRLHGQADSDAQEPIHGHPEDRRVQKGQLGCCPARTPW